jgi:hypothetical protein
MKVSNADFLAPPLPPWKIPGGIHSCRFTSMYGKYRFVVYRRTEANLSCIAHVLLGKSTVTHLFKEYGTQRFGTVTAHGPILQGIH